MRWQYVYATLAAAGVGLVGCGSEPPSPDVAITPVEPRTADDLQAQLGDQVEQDGIEFSFSWTLDGEPIGDLVEPTVPSDRTRKGERWEVTVIASDGKLAADPATAAVRIGNTAPTVAGAALSTVDIDESTVVTCVASEPQDADGDPVTFETRWLVDDQPVGTGESLTGADFDRGQQVTCELTPTDGTDAGEPVLSDPVVVGNTAPTLAGVTLTPPDPTRLDTVEAVPVDPEDADGDPVTLEVVWLVDGVEVATEGPLTGEHFARGQQLQARVTPFDGTDRGPSVTSDPSLVVNAPPVIRDLTLSPASPSVLDPIVARFTEEDPDGDTVSFKLTWTIDGEEQGVSSRTLPAGLATRGQEVRVQVVADDGDRIGEAVTSDPVTVVNTPASATAATLDPTEVFEDTTVTCVVSGWSDPDEDPEGYRYAWLVDGGSVSATGSTLDGASFDKGQTVQCSATPDDGYDLGTAVASSTLTVQNSPPSLGGASLSSTSPKEADTLSVSVSGASDPDGDSVSTSIEWYVNGTRVGSGSTLDGSDFDKGDRIFARVTPTDGTDAGTPVDTAPATAANTAPVLSSISLSPTSPKTTDAVTATGTTSDADGDRVSIDWTWYVEGIAVPGVSSDTLPSTSFSRGDEIYVVGVPDDGTDTGSRRTSSKTTAVNSSPTSPSLSLTPARPAGDDALVCTIATASTDADKDPITYSFTWTVDSTTWSGATTTTTHAGDTIPSSAVDKDEVWSCSATASDGTATSARASSSSVTVVNTPPTLSSARLSTTTPREGDTLGVTLGSATDIDGDPISYDYQWYVNGSRAGTGTTVDGDAFSKGDRVYVDVTPKDGTDSGITVRSDVATVDNTPPVVSSITLSPSTARTIDPISASAVSSDVDRDTISLSYAWTVNGSKAGTDAATLPASEHERGDVIAVTITPSDGDDSGTPVKSSTLTIQNTAPTPPGITLSPSAPVVGGSDLVCVVRSKSTDADGDSLTYTFAWEENGKSFTKTSRTTYAGDTVPSSSLKAFADYRCTATASDGTDPSASVSITTTVFSPWEHVTTGNAHTCGLNDGALYCWGRGGSGQLGLGSTSSKKEPTRVGSSSDWVQVEAIEDTTCAINSSGELYCWGENSGGTVGDGSTTDRNAPVRVGKASNWTLLAEAVSANHMCALNALGQIWCWGRNTNGQLGDGSTTHRTSPVRVTGTVTKVSVRDLYVGGYYSCAIDTKDTRHCWGDNRYDQWGVVSRSSNTSVVVGGLGFSILPETFGAGGHHGCGVYTSGSSTGELHCWGANDVGQVGDGTTTDREKPVRIGSASYWSQAYGEWRRTCAITTSNALYCWGRNTNGQVGDGSTTDRHKPAAVSGSRAWDDVDLGTHHTCAIDLKGHVYCWGQNAQGQLGDGTSTSRSKPVEIADP